mmetsp:Transcript_10849/g.10762  ORF Transcript_10849/g.10762 Transcript_10849/m.10762 type:complete len:147 (+) Transcript_10849:186-626(+)
MAPPLYKQCNSKWGSKKMGSKTVCQVGCLMSSMSMALAGLGKKISGQTVNPGNFNDWLRSHHGYSGNLYVWGAAESTFKVKYQGQKQGGTHTIDSKHITILNVRNGGHWVLATSKSGNTYKVLDPGYQKSSYTTSEVVRAAKYQIL